VEERLRALGHEVLDPGQPLSALVPAVRTGNLVYLSGHGARVNGEYQFLGKVGRDVTLMAQQEVGELREGGDPDRGGSSAMAHKRNPVGAVSVLACAKRAPGLVATILACMEQEHERAAGAWQAEWPAVSEAFRLTAGAVARTRASVEGLEVDAARMRANLELGGGFGRDRTPLEQLGKAEELIDRALAAHRKRRHQR